VPQASARAGLQGVAEPFGSLVDADAEASSWLFDEPARTTPPFVSLCRNIFSGAITRVNVMRCPEPLHRVFDTSAVRSLWRTSGCNPSSGRNPSHSRSSRIAASYSVRHRRRRGLPSAAALVPSRSRDTPNVDRIDYVTEMQVTGGRGGEARRMAGVVRDRERVHSSIQWDDPDHR
jgi:hypothetical protein